jgi:hypothetical protein
MRMKISLALAGVVALLLGGALLGAGACTPSPTLDPTDCTATNPTDAGATACAIEYSCNSDTQHYWLTCDESGSNFSCICGTDQADNAATIVVQPFPCSATGALPAVTGSGGCGWTIQLSE